MQHAAPQNILFITSNSIGDAILSTGLLAHLVDTYPNARFTIVCGPAAQDLFRAVPRLDRVIVLRKQNWSRHWLSLWKQTVGTRWEMVVDIRNSVISQVLVAKRRVRRIKATGHKVEELGAMLALMSPPAPTIWLDTTAEQAAAKLLGDSTAPILALAPAANWMPKQWPIEHYIALAKRITAADGLLPNARVLIVAAPHERTQCAALIESLPASQVIDTIGHDLLTVAACLKRARLFIGNDSGPMHLATAARIPTLGLFGPGYEHIYGPWGALGKIIRTPEPRETLLATLDETGNAPNLMQTLSVDAVLTAAKQLLDATAASCAA